MTSLVTAIYARKSYIENMCAKIKEAVLNQLNTSQEEVSNQERSSFSGMMEVVLLTED
jgi:hypothetical protein